MFSYCFPQILFFFISATGLHSCFFTFFIIKLNKMVKLDLLLNLISTSNLFASATILSDFMVIIFFSRMTQLFPLRCEGPVDFEYQLIYVQPHPSFTVHPMNGKPYN